MIYFQVHKKKTVLMTNTAVKHHLKESIFMRQETHFAPRGEKQSSQSPNFNTQLCPSFSVVAPIQTQKSDSPQV